MYCSFYNLARIINWTEATNSHAEFSWLGQWCDLHPRSHLAQIIDCKSNVSDSQPHISIYIRACQESLFVSLSSTIRLLIHIYTWSFSESRFYMYIYSPTLYITYTHTRIGKYFFLFSSGRQWSIWMFVCECTGSPCKTLWWWAYYSERRMALFIYLFFFSIDSNSRARVCVYVCVYIRMRVRIRIHIRAPMTRIIFISVLSSRRCGPGMEDFFFVVFRWLVDWLIGSWVEDPADLRRDVWRIYYVDAVSISMYMYIRCQRIGIYIYNIYHRTVYPISKIDCCWCCYYYCRCCCCACSCCWCLVILLYTPFVFS